MQFAHSETIIIRLTFNDNLKIQLCKSSSVIYRNVKQISWNTFRCPLRTYLVVHAQLCEIIFTEEIYWEPFNVCDGCEIPFPQFIFSLWCFDPWNIFSDNEMDSLP